MELKSKTIYLRLVELKDATFIHSLRTDKKYSKYLSFVDNDISKQVKWIADYKKREGREFYYIIHRNSDSIPIGTVRIYDFIKEDNSFSWGSLILTENKTRYAVLECALLIYDYAFFELGFNCCNLSCRKQNEKSVKFHKRLGVKTIGETEDDYLWHYFLKDYLLIRGDIEKVINK